MNELRIRTASPEDAPKLADLMTQLGYSTSPREMEDRLAAIIPDPGYMTFVAEDQSRVIGMIGLGIFKYYEKNGVYGRILTLVVDEERRGESVGSLLIDEAESWLAGRCATATVINCGKHRKDTHRFYTRHGYEETGLRFVKLLS